jgi:tetrahydromethanopterin S-methyltransferase subunit G
MMQRSITRADRPQVATYLDPSMMQGISHEQMSLATSRGVVNDALSISPRADVAGNDSGFINDCRVLSHEQMSLATYQSVVRARGFITQANVPGQPRRGSSMTAGYITRATCPWQPLRVYALMITHLSQVKPMSTGNLSGFVNEYTLHHPSKVSFATSTGFINDLGYNTSDWLSHKAIGRRRTRATSYIANKPANLSQFANDLGFIVQDSTPSLRGLTITGDLIVANGVLHTNVSPVFNGSFWSISDNPIQKPTALSEALKIGGYIFDAGQVLWDGAQQAQLMFNQGQMADQMAAQTASDVAERLNDPENELTINWSAVSQKPLANKGISQDIGIAGGLVHGRIYLPRRRCLCRSRRRCDVGGQRIEAKEYWMWARSV